MNKAIKQLFCFGLFAISLPLYSNVDKTPLLSSKNYLHVAKKICSNINSSDIYEYVERYNNEITYIIQKIDKIDSEDQNFKQLTSEAMLFLNNLANYSCFTSIFTEELPKIALIRFLCLSLFNKIDENKNIFCKVIMTSGDLLDSSILDVLSDKQKNKLLEIRDTLATSKNTPDIPLFKFSLIVEANEVLKAIMHLKKQL